MVLARERGSCACGFAKLSVEDNIFIKIGGKAAFAPVTFAFVGEYVEENTLEAYVLRRAIANPTDGSFSWCPYERSHARENRTDQPLGSGYTGKLPGGPGF